MTAKKPIVETTDEPILSRWARVKHSQKQETPLSAAEDADKSLPAALPNTSIDALPEPKIAEKTGPEPTLSGGSATVELPSLESLTPESDFSPFMAKDVDSQVRNKAMKKLFTDPHYNVMDRLDTYIDDYSVHTPLPLDVIRQMNIAKTLGLFDDEETADDADAVKVSVQPASVRAEMIDVQQQVETDESALLAEKSADPQTP